MGTNDANARLTPAWNWPGKHHTVVERVRRTINRTRLLHTRNLPPVLVDCQVFTIDPIRNPSRSNIDLVHRSQKPFEPGPIKSAGRDTRVEEPTGTSSDNSAQKFTGSVTWESSKPAVASISATGLATAVTKGKTSIKAAPQLRQTLKVHPSTVVNFIDVEAP